MSLLFICGLSLALLIGGCIALYLLTARRYQSSDSVANSYDQWTEDGILEFYWGEHIHLGHYGTPPRRKDFLVAKEDFVHEMVRWGGLDKLPIGTTVLDVGCGIGGSSRILAQDYGFAVTGVTISPQQVKRAQTLTPDRLTAQFQVDDAMALSFPDASFDAVWSIEAGPHMPDKAIFARELLRVLKPGGVLVVADWNQRDTRQKPLNVWEGPVMRQLLDQWSHPEFASIEGFAKCLTATGLVEGEVTTTDWTEPTLPSWLDAIWQGVVRPQGWVKYGPSGFIKSVREVPTILLMRLAFGTGLCRFGMFRAIRGNSGYLSGLEQYSAMARGQDGIQALEMTKWFDPNYHYLVSEIEANSKPQANVADFLETVQRLQALLGDRAVPIIFSLVTLLKLSRLEGDFTVHSSAVASIEQMLQQLRTGVDHLPIAQIWINPDCGLKTRRWEEVIPALKNMVTATKVLREQINANP